LERLMKPTNSVDVSKNFGAYRALAEQAPVFVQHYNKPSIVMLSAAEYARLKRRDRQVLASDELPEWMVDKIAAANVGDKPVAAKKKHGAAKA
jgi:hypothetical protein